MSRLFIPAGHARCFAFGCKDGFINDRDVSGVRRNYRCDVCGGDGFVGRESVDALRGEIRKSAAEVDRLIEEIAYWRSPEGQANPNGGEGTIGNLSDGLDFERCRLSQLHGAMHRIKGLSMGYRTAS